MFKTALLMALYIGESQVTHMEIHLFADGLFSCPVVVSHDSSFYSIYSPETAVHLTLSYLTSP